MNKLLLLLTGACTTLAPASAQPLFQNTLFAGISLPVNVNKTEGTYAGQAIHLGNHLDYTFGDHAFRWGLGAYMGYLGALGASDNYKQAAQAIAQKNRLSVAQLTYNATNFKSVQVLFGPVAAITAGKYHINAWAKGGYGINEPARYAVVYRENGVNTNVYVNQPGDNKNGLSYDFGAGLSYAVSAAAAIQLSAGYFGANTEQISYNYEREKGTAPNYYTAVNNFLQVSAGVRLTVGDMAKSIRNKNVRRQFLKEENAYSGDTSLPVMRVYKSKSNVKNNFVADNGIGVDASGDSLFFSPGQISLRNEISRTPDTRLLSVDDYLTGFVYQTAGGPVIGQCGPAAMPGDPVPGIDVRLRNATSNEVLSARTNRDGSFAFNNISAGNYLAEAGGAQMNVTVAGNNANNFRLLDIEDNTTCSASKKNYILMAGDKMYAEIVSARETGSGMASGRVLPTVNKREIAIDEPGVHLTRENGTGLATGKRMHKPMLVTDMDFELNWNNIISSDDKMYAEIITAREAGSGMATGRRMIVTGDLDGDGIQNYAVQSPRDAASGLATGKRMHRPMVIRVDEEAAASEIVSPRDAASGMPTGKRMHKPIVITIDMEDGDENETTRRDAASGLATGKRMHKPMVIRIDADANEAAVISPRDAASGLATGKRMHKPIVITKEIDAVTNETPAEWGVGTGMLTGRRLNQKVDGDNEPWSSNEEESVVSNPLYEGSSGSVINPVYEGKSAISVSGSNGSTHHIFMPSVIHLSVNNPVAGDNYNVLPIKWMSPEALAAKKGINEAGIKKNELASKKGITEKGIKLTAEDIEDNVERKGWDGTVKGSGKSINEKGVKRVAAAKNIVTSESNLKGGAMQPNNDGTGVQIKEITRMHCINGTCVVDAVVESNGKQYEAAISGVLKTRHETAKNSIGNIR